MNLLVSKFPSQCEDALPIVLLHGWGMGSSIWMDCVEALSTRHPVYAIDMPGYFVGEQAHASDSKDYLFKSFDEAGSDIQAQLLAWRCELPEAFVLVGFSLGGALASVLSESLFRGAIGLVTVSTNARFVTAEGWDNAVSDSTFTQFLSDFDADSTALMKRFCLLQSRGGRDEKKTRQWLLGLQAKNAGLSDAVSLSWLRFGLDALLNLDLRTQWPSQRLPLLHQFGAHDALVPAAAANDIARLSSARVEFFAESGHLPFVSERRAWVDSILNFAKGLSTTVDSKPRHV